MLNTAFDAYLTLISPGAVSLVHKSVNLKEPYNEDIKGKVLKKEDTSHEIPNPRGIV